MIKRSWAGNFWLNLFCPSLYQPFLATLPISYNLRKTRLFIHFKTQWTGKCHSHLQHALGENCALAANQSVDCQVTILFTISLNSAKVWNRGIQLASKLSIFSTKYSICLVNSNTINAFKLVNSQILKNIVKKPIIMTVKLFYSYFTDEYPSKWLIESLFPHPKI